MWITHIKDTFMDVIFREGIDSRAGKRDVAVMVMAISEDAGREGKEPQEEHEAFQFHL